MNKNFDDLLLKLTDYEQDITDMERLLIANEIMRLNGELAEAQGAIDYAALYIAKPEAGKKFN